MRYHLFQKFFGKMVKIKETSFLSTRGMTLMFGNCILKISWKSSKYGLSYILQGNQRSNSKFTHYHCFVLTGENVEKRHCVSLRGLMQITS